MKALVIGYGSIGKRHIKNLSLFSNMEILVCTQKKPDSFLKKINCKVINSIDKCIELNPNFAIISNITSKHIAIAKKLANAGIHFLCEKPLSNNLEGVQDLLKIIERKKLITLMGCNLRFHPCLIKLKKILEKKQIGRIISAQIENGSYLPEWHPNENYRDSYASKKDSGGVILTCIHELDYLRWFFGMPKEVYSVTGKFSNLAISTSDHSSIVLKFSNRMIAEIHLDFYQKPPARSCKIIGTEGQLFWNAKLNTVNLFKIKSKKWVTKLALKNYDNNQMYLDELKYFLKCIRGIQKSMNNVNEGDKILKLGLSIIRSSKMNKPISLK